eukprot:TRINITY_DN164_c0_g1_i18.p1 TRINITY_DN164_c0_g1~~TRINITY_DN164_c0_g1_i18.p1  ORF type:complete len:467 (-),score=175.53 TRINITY_DN164_c0_g1_i18:738-2138(-)
MQSSTTMQVMTSLCERERVGEEGSTLLWLTNNYESYQPINTSNEDESSMDDIINTSDFQTSYDELQHIEEVVFDSSSSSDANGVCSSSSKEEALRSSILEELFPEESMEISPSSDNIKDNNDIERNNLLIAEVERYLTSVTGGEPTLTNTISDEEFTKCWENLPSAPSPPTSNVYATPPPAASSAVSNNLVVSNAGNIIHGSSSADKIFDALTKGQVMLDESADYGSANNTADVLQQQAVAPPTSFTAIDSTSGEKVIVVIAPPSPPQPSNNNIKINNTQWLNTDALKVETPQSPAYSSYSNAMSPGAASSIAEESSSAMSPAGSVTSGGGMTSDYDEDWKPPQASTSRRRQQRDTPAATTAAAAAKKPRKKYERKVPLRGRPVDISPAHYPKNKVERKKLQNRNAAWKYREKKKMELAMADQELEQLLTRNVELKSKLSKMEIEWQLLKNLMKETGLGHLMADIM